MRAFKDQLELLGIEETRRLVETEPKSIRSRKIGLIDTTHDLMTRVPGGDDLTFNHSGLCQTSLPHSRLANNQTVWKRTSGRFTLMVTPGVISKGPTTSDDYVGVPYGTKARLIMFHLQTEGLKSRTVSLGKNLSAFLHSLGLPRSGGPRGSITHVREQCMRIARCTFTLQWSQTEAHDDRMLIQDTKIVDGLEMLNATSDDWSATVELSEHFHSNLIEHAVPLDRRSIALLSYNSLGLDLYALFAYRLPKLSANLNLTWRTLQEQVGSEYAEPRQLARKVREVMPEIMAAYPHANVEVGPYGLLMKPSKPSVPRTMVPGFRLIDGA